MRNQEPVVHLDPEIFLKPMYKFWVEDANRFEEPPVLADPFPSDGSLSAEIYRLLSEQANGVMMLLVYGANKFPRTRYKNPFPEEVPYDDDYFDVTEGRVPGEEDHIQDLKLDLCITVPDKNLFLDFMFILKQHLSEDGVAYLLLSHSALFSSKRWNALYRRWRPTDLYLIPQRSPIWKGSKGTPPVNYLWARWEKVSPQAPTQVHWLPGQSKNKRRS